MEEIKWGQIWYVKRRDKDGHIQTGDRPAIVVSNDIGNNHSPMVNVVPLTTNLDKKPLPTHCEIISSPYKSIALCEQVIPINKEDLIYCVGECKTFEMRQVKVCLMIQFNII